MKSCDECKWCVVTEEGYSNYTVEGVVVDCLLRLNPDFSKDRFYGEDASLNFAESCLHFEEGEPFKMDVEMYNDKDILDIKDAVLRHLLLKYFEYFDF